MEGDTTNDTTSSDAAQGSAEAATTGKKSRPVAPQVPASKKKSRPGEATASEPKVKSSLELAMAEGVKLKAHYMSASSGFSMVMQNIQHETNWQWAKKMDCDLKDAFQSMNDKLSNFARRFFTEELKAIKKDYSTSVLEAELLRMNSDMKEAVQQVLAGIDTLKEMHLGRMKARPTSHSPK